MISDFKNFIHVIKSGINWVNSVLTIFFIGGICLTVFEIDIYHKTFINWTIPTFIWFLTGIGLTPLMSNFLKKYYDTRILFFHLTFNIATWGGLVVYGFMATNYHFPKKISKTITTEIIKTGHLAKGRRGCGNPYCEIVIDKKKKQLVFPCDVEIEKYNFVELTIKEGLLGYDIITKTELKNWIIE